jgi:RNA polymerase sigma-70 factor (ECF subfamily)
MNSQPDDALLMDELALGRDGALDELMKRWGVRLRCFIDRMVGSPTRTDEVWQDVWTRIYLYRRKYDTRRPFRPFLFTVALNACRSALSRLGGQYAWSGEETLARLPAAQSDPAEGLLAAEQRQELHQAIGRLPHMQRAVVLLYLLCDSDYGRIAEVLGRSPSTIRSQMHYALRNLREHLDKPHASPAPPAGCEVKHDRLEN